MQLLSWRRPRISPGNFLAQRKTLAFSLSLFCVLLTPLSARDEAAPPPWIAEVPAPVPGKFPSPQSASLTYRAGWAGLVAGRVTATFTARNSTENLRLVGGTVGPARLLYQLDTDSASTCEDESFAPISADIREVYQDGQQRTVQKFTATEVSRIRTCLPPRKDDGSKKVFLPHVFDMQGSLLYVRSQPLQPGQEFTFLAYATDSPYHARVTVVGREEISVAGKKFPAVKLHLDLQTIDKHLALKKYKKAKNITAWVSDDQDRHFLKFTADLLIGSVFVELESVAPASS